MSSERFWLEQPICLLSSTTLIPNCTMTTAARLNALTRLIILISLVLYFFCLCQWWLFLLLGLLLVIILYYLDPHKKTPCVENYICSKPKRIPTVLWEELSADSFQPYD
jgi:hypothetical protein